MKLKEEDGAWIIRLAHERPDLKIELNKKERKTLEDAIAICEKAEQKLYKEWEENNYGWAAIYLREVLEQ